MRYSVLLSRTLALGLGLAVFAAAGCGPSNATLTGKVTYKGTALKGGNVTLVPEGSGETFSAAIQEDGTYKFEHLKSGKYKVCVDTSSLKPKSNFGGGKFGPKVPANIKNEPPPGANIPEGASYKGSPPVNQVAKENALRYVPIPPEYADPDKTRLKFDVRGGSNTYDIPLE